MKVLPKSVENLIESFEKLPGIGPKTASRLTFYLLHVPQEAIEHFAQSLLNLKKMTVFCSTCFNIGENDPCAVCINLERDESTVCVVEQPLDILSFERTGKYKGVYHVLQGVINPLDNIGPDELKIAELLKRIKAGKIKEVILATNTNMEGEATAMYIRREILNLKAENATLTVLKMTRLAHGLPVGADLEYADEVTLTQSLEGRRDF
jgi:recombination protein RecR